MKKLPTTWAQVCKIQGIDPKVIPTFDGVDDRYKKTLIASWKIMNIAEALNGKDFKPDYSDPSQAKWYPWFEWDRTVSAFRFWYANYGYSGAYASSGARHVFKTKDLVKHATTHFLAVYNDLLKPE